MTRAPAGHVTARPDGTIVEANETFLDWTGLGRDRVVGRTLFRDLLATGSAIYHETHYLPLLLMQDEVREISMDLKHAGGGSLPILVSSVLDRDDDGEAAAIRMTVTYARERRQYENELRRDRELADHLQRATARLAHALDERGVAAIVAATVADAIDCDGTLMVVNRTVAGDGPVADWQRSRKPRQPDGPQLWLATPIRSGCVTAAVVYVARRGAAAFAPRDHAFLRDCAIQVLAALDRIALLATVARLAGTDELTGLPNRRTWSAQMARELARSRRRGEPLTLAILDLDHFKRFNDTYGHPAGDRLLAGVAAIWSSLLRPDDMLARYGGEEFVLLVAGCGLDESVALAERLRAAVPDDATCSIGLAEWDGVETASELFERADRALYRAKQSGRDRVERATAQ